MSKETKYNVNQERADLQHKANGKSHSNGPSERASKDDRVLGKRLRALRQRVVDSGEVLLDWDGVSREVTERRRGVS